MWDLDPYPGGALHSLIGQSQQRPYHVAFYRLSLLQRCQSPDHRRFHSTESRIFRASNLDDLATFIKAANHYKL